MTGPATMWRRATWRRPSTTGPPALAVALSTLVFAIGLPTGVPWQVALQAQNPPVRLAEDVESEPLATDELLAILEDDDPMARARALPRWVEGENRGLEIDAERRAEIRLALPTLERLLVDDPVAEVRARVAEVLGFLGAEAAQTVPRLLDAAQESEARVRAEAMWALGELGPPTPEALEVFRRGLHDPDPEVVLQTLGALEHYGPDARSLFEHALPLATHGDPRLRAATASLLAELGSGRRDGELLAALAAYADRETESWVRDVAESALDDLRERGRGRQSWPLPELHRAAREGHLPRVLHLLEGGVSPNDEATWGRTPLMEAAAGGQPRVVEALLAAGARTGTVDWSRQDALMHAATRCKLETSRTLVDAGASLEHLDGNGETVLSKTVDVGCEPVAEMLRRAGATTGVPPLIEALRRGDMVTALGLVAAGRGLLATDATGKSALHWAASEGRIPVLEALIEAGIPLDLRDRQRQTPLMRAAARGGLDAIALLVGSGADLDARDTYDLTALRHAIRAREKEAVRLLLDRGADPTIQGKDGERAWTDALKREDPQLLEWLESAGGRFDPPANPSALLAARVVHEGPDVLVIDIDYYDDGTVERLWLGAITLEEGFSTGHWSYRPARTHPGEHCGRVVLGMNREAPDRYASDTLSIEMYVGGGGVTQKLELAHRKTWQRGDDATDPDAWGSRCTLLGNENDL